MQEDARKTTADGAGGASLDHTVQKFSPLPTNARLADMTVQSVLGAGENGITYICVQEGNARRFVVKEFLPRAIAFRDGPTVRVASTHTPAYAWGLDRFLNEGRTIAKLKHPAIVPVLSVLEANGTGYVVMAHEVGRDLAIWQHELRRTPTQQELDQIAEPLLQGLAVLHSRQILHLDIQPAHIVIRDGGAPVLIDFGAVRLAMRKRLNVPTPRGGTAFMAPEVLAGTSDIIGPASDIYAMAAVLYMLVTGNVPPEAESRALRDTLVPASQAANGKWRPQFLNAIDLALNYRPDDRPQKVDLWLADLMRKDASPARRTAAVAEPAPDADATTVDRPRDLRSAQGDDAEPQPAEAWTENVALRPVLFALAGGLAGALLGALSSIVIASVVWSSCMTDQCVAPVLPYTTIAGLAVGLYLGARYGRSAVTGDGQYPPHPQDEA